MATIPVRAAATGGYSHLAGVPWLLPAANHQGAEDAHAYEDSVLGRIPDEQYRILSQEYTTEQKEIQEQLPAMEVRLQELKDSSTNIARFIENAKRYKEIPELTAEILRIFIKRVEVGERAEKYSRTAPQEVRIYYRDIGLVDELPQSMADSMAEEIPNEVA